MTTVLSPGPMTETDALNTVLTVIGEAPVDSILDATQADVVQIIGLFKSVISEIQVMRWRFNTEFGYQLQPSGQLIYGDINNVVETLNIFEVPSNLADFKVNPGVAQVGANFPDVTSRRAQYFQDPPTSGVYPLIFYDRSKNREGLNAAQFAWLALDVTWFIPFEDMPVAAQHYIVKKTARMAAEQIVNANEIAQAVKTDEAYAYAHLVRSQRPLDNLNIFRSVNAWRHYGGRPVVNAGFIDTRGLAPSYPAPTQPAFPVLTLTPTAPTASVGIGSSGNTQSWTLVNTSSFGGPVGTYQAIAIADGLVVTSAVIAPLGPFTLQPGDSQTVTVTFNAAIAGSGSIQILFMNQQVADAAATLTVTAS